MGEENPEFGKIISLVESVKLSDQSTELNFDLDLKKLFPGSVKFLIEKLRKIKFNLFVAENLGKYWAYIGSLTTPPCSESVKWIVFTDTIEMSAQQVKYYNCDYIFND